jgi:CSLREA domain-containing protein
VDTLIDELNNDGDCSLREAITAANDNVPVDACPSGDGVLTDTISFNVAGTITLTEQLSVTSGGPVVIDGGEVITVSGGHSVQGIYVGNGTQLSLNQLTVADGWRDGEYVIANGGGIENYGSLKIFDSKISNNRVIYSEGGGIANYGSLEIFDSTISDNFGYPANGSGIANDGFLSIENTTLINNYVGGGYGSGIWNDGLLIITNTLFSNNIADDMIGGGIANYGVLSITHSTFSNNQAYFSGGGIENGGMANIADCQFIGNQASDGGGINNTGTMTVSNSTFKENNASIGGGILMDITDEDTSINIYNSTFYLNYADTGGAIYVDGDSAQDRIFITNSTFVSNIANSGGAFYQAGGIAEIFNSILTDSLFDENCWGLILAEGHNIDSGDSCGFDSANGSLINTDPLVGPLLNNGGETPTHALLDGSPAIDAADPLNCPSTDQRGVPRPQDGDSDGIAICDIGSFEYLIPQTVIDVTIDGPTTGDVQGSYTFTATSSPISATLPITYIWQATGHMSVTHTSGLTDTIVYTWTLPGTQVLTVTATNILSMVSDTHVITTTEPMEYLYLPLILKGQIVGGVSRTSAPSSAGVSLMPIMLPSSVLILLVPIVGTRRLKKRK